MSLRAVLLACVLTVAVAVPGVAATREHTVRAGESLTSIARAYGTSVEALAALNNITDPNRVYVGQRLKILPEVAGGQPPMTHVVQKGESLSVIAKRYGVSVRELALWNGVQDPNRIRVGQELVVAFETIAHRVQPGENVTKIANTYGVTVASITALNDLKDPDRLQVGQVLAIPPMGGGVVEALARMQPLVYRRTLDRWPASGTVSSEFGPRGGRMHEGIDIAVPHGTPVRAVAAGRVIYADWAGTYGILVRIDHGGGVETRYAHNSRLEVSPGQWVQSGQVIARAGSTGRSTGPHVHFEVRVNDEAIDPRGWLP